LLLRSQQIRRSITSLSRVRARVCACAHVCVRVCVFSAQVAVGQQLHDDGDAVGVLEVVLHLDDVRVPDRLEDADLRGHQRARVLINSIGRDGVNAQTRAHTRARAHRFASLIVVAVAVTWDQHYQAGRDNGNWRCQGGPATSCQLMKITRRWRVTHAADTTQAKKCYSGTTHTHTHAHTHTRWQRNRKTENGKRKKRQRTRSSDFFSMILTARLLPCPLDPTDSMNVRRGAAIVLVVAGIDDGAPAPPTPPLAPPLIDGLESASVTLLPLPPLPPLLLRPPPPPPPPLPPPPPPVLPLTLAVVVEDDREASAAANGAAAGAEEEAPLAAPVAPTPAAEAAAESASLTSEDAAGSRSMRSQR
jgi:hypothetical protein